jgi:hypothetical protein
VGACGRGRTGGGSDRRQCERGAPQLLRAARIAAASWSICAWL